MTDRKTLKQNAREAMAQTRPRPIWVTLGVLVILLALAVLNLTVTGDWEVFTAAMKSYLETGELVMAETETGEIGAAASILALALELMSMVVSVGYTLYTLRINRRQKASFGDVLDAFGVFFRAIWITVLQNLLISFASLAYMLPATLLSLQMDSLLAMAICLPLMAVPYVTMYSYRQGVFIMLDNPQLPCMQCLNLSRAAMRGHKWELFKLDLSFLGWALLCLVPFAALWVVPYMSATRAGYYDALVPSFLGSLHVPPQDPPSGDPPRYHTPGGDDNDRN